MKKPNRDAVLQQVETTYDSNSHVVLVTAKQRFHDETGTGALGTASTGVKARVSYAASYYDGADRLTGVVDVGTNGGSSYTRPSTVPSRSDTVLVTTTAYNSAGLAWKLIDPRGIETRSYFNALGDVTKSIENYVDGVVSDTDDKTTESTYNAVGLTTVKVVLPSSGQQVTEWVYGVTTSGGSGLNSNDLVKEVRYPDPSTGASSSSSKDVLTVNALGQALTMTDRNGTVHSYSYDVVGRQTADAITTLGSGVNGTVRRLNTAYDTQGNPYLFTAYDASSGGNIVNQVKRDFNGLGQLTAEWQSHSGAVTGSSPRVQYAYSEMTSGANHSRLTSMTYASGYAVNYNYATGLDANISRLSSLSDASNTLEAYSYLGLGSVVKRAHSQPGVDLSYIKLSTESVGDAGDQYTGLDRFGRVVDQRWINGSNTDVDRYQYGYDRDDNRLYKDNKVIASLSEVYTYDSLNQLGSYKLGTLNGTKTDVTGSPSNSQSWDYDAVGNWDSITTNSTTQTRTANKQNEITAVSGATTPTYDSNGNLTTDENNYRFVYDAWNKVVQVKNSSNVAIVTYGRDALHRHVTDTVGSTVTDRFFSSDWQLLETKVGSNTVTRNVWSPVYIDGLVLRDQDTDANGTLDERLYALQDANWNTTALVNAGGTVQERYTYTPFGQVTFRDGSGSTLSGSAKDWVFLHQGGERIAAGDYEFRNRVYSPSLGRWLSNDPLGFDAGDQNWFRAVRNNPGNGLDPIGLDEWWFWKDPLYLVPFREQNLWVDIRNNLIPKRSKAYIESPIGQVFDPNKTDNPNPTLGSYLDADFRDSVQVTKQGMMRHVGEELAEKAAGAVAVGAAGVAAKKIYDARKALKIRAPSGFTGRFARMNPNDIRFSQNSAGGSGRAAQLRESMRNGWNGPAVDAVETVDGIVTIDNTRIVIARELGITEVPVKIRLPSDPLPDSMLGRFGDARTWGEALRFRTGNQRPPLPPTGTRTYRDCRTEGGTMSIDFMEPWVRVGQFADNLVKELRREVVNGHPLWNKDVRAIAQRTDSDDVLFEVEGVVPTFAVVHLTWSGEPENNPMYPDAKLFSSLDQWIRDGMIPDHKEFVG